MTLCRRLKDDIYRMVVLPESRCSCPSFCRFLTWTIAANELCLHMNGYFVTCRHTAIMCRLSGACLEAYPRSRLAELDMLSAE